LQPTYENHSVSCVHKGHVHLSPEEVHTPLNQLDENALELAPQMHELQLDDSPKAKLINVRSEASTKFTPSHIQYAIARFHAKKICNDVDHKQSSAEQLHRTNGLGEFTFPFLIPTFFSFFSSHKLMTRDTTLYNGSQCTNNQYNTSH